MTVGVRNEPQHADCLAISLGFLRHLRLLRSSGDSQMKCWICGADADSGEHVIKASDLRSVFGHVSAQHPLYLSTDLRRNQRVKGQRADILKLNARICGKCNTQRTQPYDLAWEQLSRYLRSRKRVLKPNERIGLHKVFPGSVKRSMVGVHLYFVKLLGCHIAEHHMAIDLGPFSQALLHGSAHPLVYLAFCSPIDGGLKSVGYTDMSVVRKQGKISFAVWFYCLDRFAVRVMYAEPGEHRQGLIDSWHPSKITKHVRIGNT
jgi:hypothetical protein